MLAPIGRLDITSQPPAITTSCVPLITACAAKWIACCDEPHWRSTVVPGTLIGRFDESTTLRQVGSAPTWLTQPQMTSSTTEGSKCWCRVASAHATLAMPRTAGW